MHLLRTPPDRAPLDGERVFVFTFAYLRNSFLFLGRARCCSSICESLSGAHALSCSCRFNSVNLHWTVAAIWFGAQLGLGAWWFKYTFVASWGSCRDVRAGSFCSPSIAILGGRTFHLDAGEGLSCEQRYRLLPSVSAITKIISRMDPCCPSPSVIGIAAPL